jgi:hypothetical protein
MLDANGVFGGSFPTVSVTAPTGAIETYRDTIVAASSANGGSLVEYSDAGVFLSVRATGLGTIEDIALEGSVGHVYAVDSAGCRVLEVSLEDGSSSVVAGTGTCGFNGDGAAAATQLNAPKGIATGGGSSILVADTGNDRVRLVIPGGNATTLAGSGVHGTGGNGGPALGAELSGPADVIQANDGGYVITEESGNDVRRVTAGGTISRIAGTTVAGSSGDGGAATAAQLNGPRGIARELWGGLIVADTGNNAVRLLNADL